MDINENPSNFMKKNFIPYIGGKYKLRGMISARLHATGRTCLVDVFGGSGAVTLHSGFGKRVYNDINGDIVNLFRVMADDGQRRMLLRKLRWTPPSRQIFEDDYAVFRRAGFSFGPVECPIERARMTFYRHIFCFGGKTRTGGFAVSTNDRKHIKEVYKYHNTLRHLSHYGKFFSNTVIENLDFSDLIEKYRDKEQVVFFVDPPYPGYAAYYSHNLSVNQHRQLADSLTEASAAAVCTFYDHPLVRRLYPSGLWSYEVVNGVKNSIRGGGQMMTDELILTKNSFSPDQACRKRRQIVSQMIMEFGRS